MNLYSKVALITGGSQGLGFEIARQFLLENASVVICGRNQKSLDEARKELLLIAPPEAILTFQCDVSQEREVLDLREFIFNHHLSLDVLVNNAGIHGPLGSLESLNSDFWKKAIEVNLFGVFHCCHTFLPHMKEQKKGKVINISGGGATKAFPNFSAYAASKAAIVRLTETLAMELSEFNVDVNVVAPGTMATRLLNEVLESGSEKIGSGYFEQMLKVQKTGGVSPVIAAKLCVYLACEKSNGITGKLLAAMWDPWENLHEYRDLLQKSDIYNLRRIIPSDRGQGWGDRS